MTFLVGLAGIAALLPLGRLAVGRWAGFAAIALCLMTGYLYGSLFFTPIDVPFLAAMTWATLAIVVMTRQVLPSWRATIVAGLLTGLGDRHAHRRHHHPRLSARGACPVRRGSLATRHGRLTLRYLAADGRALRRPSSSRLGHRDCALAVAADRQSVGAVQDRARAFRDHPDVVRILRIGASGYRPTRLPRSYIPAQLLARLPEAFLVLLAVAFVYAIAATAIARARDRGDMARIDAQRGPAGGGADAGARARHADRVRGRRSPARHFSFFSVRPSTTACATCCSSFPCWR